MFLMNIESWRDDEFLVANYAPEEIDDLAAKLRNLASSDHEDSVAWTFREIALRRPV